jgi:hypothetical protein
MELVVWQASDPPAYRRAVERLNAVEGTSIAYLNAQDFGDEAEIEEAIAYAEQQLVPAGEEAAVAGIEYCVALLSAKMPEANIVKGYASILGELPASLLPKALKAACSAANFHKLPPPGAFMKSVEADLNSLRERVARLRRHRDRMQLANRIRSHHAKPAVEAPGSGGSRQGRHFTGTTERSPS